MTKALLATVLVMWTLSACRTKSVKDKADSLQASLPYDTSTTAVLSWDKAFYNIFDRLNHRSATLTKKDLELVDKAFYEIIQGNNWALSQENDLYKIDLDSKHYRKQLIVVTNSKDEREVWVNCFCSHRDKSWRTSIVTSGYHRYCFFNFN